MQLLKNNVDSYHCEVTCFMDVLAGKYDGLPRVPLALLFVGDVTCTMQER